MWLELPVRNPDVLESVALRFYRPYPWEGRDEHRIDGMGRGV